jgi:nitrate/nitrite transport system permease protein
MMTAAISMRAAILSVLLLVISLGLWEVLCREPAGVVPAADDEYALLMGAADQEARVPPPSVVCLCMHSMS